MDDPADEAWWWSDPAGALKAVGGKELRAGLRIGKITPRTLVWKTGWATWYHASTVAELADAIPTLARRPRIAPELDASKTEPPPPPLEKYASYDRPGRVGTRRSSVPPPRPGGVPPRPAPPAPRIPRLAARASEMPPRAAPSPLRPPAAPSRPHTTPPPPPVRSPSRPRTTPPPPPVRTGPRTAPPPPPRRGPASAPPPASPPPSSQELTSRIIDVDSPTEPALPEVDIESVFEDDEAPTQERGGATYGGDDSRTEAPSTGSPADAAPGIVLASMPDAPDAADPAPADLTPPPPEAAVALPATTSRAAPILTPPLPDFVRPPEALAAGDDAPEATAAPETAAVADSAVALPEPTAPPHVAPLPDIPPPPVADPGQEPEASVDDFVPRHPLGALGTPRTRVAVVGGVVGVSALVLLVAGISHLFGGKDHGNANGATASSAPVASTAPAHSALPTAPTAPAAPAKPPRSASAAACTIDKPAQKLARSVAPNVPLYLSDVPGSTHLALGYASGARAAVGVTIDPATLAVDKAFHKDGTRDVLGVVPLTTGGKLVFAPDRDGSPLGYAHTIDGTPPFIVGLVAGGFARTIGYSEPDIVWPGGGDERITAPRVASVHDQGHVVAFRRGGRTGEIRVGWLTIDGKRKSELGTVKADGPRVGTPSVATNGEEVLITFAARPADDAPWKVRYAHAPVDHVPDQSSVFDVPAGGPGGDAISPAAAAPGGARWLLQWTEGTSGAHVVRVQTLDRKLGKVGSAVTVSPPGKDAGQGAIWASGHSAVAFFLIKDGDDYALWGTSLTCP